MNTARLSYCRGVLQKALISLLFLVIGSVILTGCEDSKLETPSSEALDVSVTEISESIIPTLTFEESEILLQELMASNGDCQLPCWWGVNIGDSLESVGQKFSGMGMRSNWNTRPSNLGDNGLMGGIHAGYYDIAKGLFYLDIPLKFHADIDGNVQYIRISVTKSNSGRGEPMFMRDWQQYSLDAMLQNYGSPSQVYLRIRSVADVTPTPIYSLSLFYPEKGISIIYNLEGKWLDDNQLDAEFCLDMKSTNPLEIALFNPDDFEKWAEYFPPYNDELYARSTWEAKTGMDLETFYQTYKDSKNPNCIQILN